MTMVISIISIVILILFLIDIISTVGGNASCNSLRKLSRKKLFVLILQNINQLGGTSILKSF